MNGFTYAIQRNGKTIVYDEFISTSYVGDYQGTVSAFFGNFPQQEMEINAFFDNTGYESPAASRLSMGSVKITDYCSDYSEKVFYKVKLYQIYPNPMGNGKRVIDFIGQ